MVFGDDIHMNHYRFNSYRYDPRCYQYNNQTHTYEYLYDDTPLYSNTIPHQIPTHTQTHNNQTFTPIQTNNYTQNTVNNYFTQKKSQNNIHINIEIHKQIYDLKENISEAKADLEMISDYLDINTHKNKLAGKGAQAAKVLKNIKNKRI
jgi:hypothetical protein